MSNKHDRCLILRWVTSHSYAVCYEVPFCISCRDSSSSSCTLAEFVEWYRGEFIEFNKFVGRSCAITLHHAELCISGRHSGEYEPADLRAGPDFKPQLHSIIINRIVEISATFEFATICTFKCWHPQEKTMRQVTVLGYSKWMSHHRTTRLLVE